MSTLTLEQKKRIEENRRKALERRAAAEAARGNLSSNIKPCFSNNVYINTNKSSNVSYTNGSDGINKYLNKVTINSVKPQSFYHNKNILNSEQNSNKDGGIHNFTGKKITGTFLLISTKRFIVDINYHSQAVEIFKSMPSKQYDASSKKWSFSMSDHDKLVTALNPLRPGLYVSPLPTSIHQALKKSAKYLPLTNIDLINVESSLLETFMPFQREGVCFGISRGGRVLIADDMGLGKTIQALGIASYYRYDWPLLIIAPSSVRYSWAEAIDRWIGSVNMDEVVVANTGKDSLSGEVVIMSYDLLTRREKEISEMGFKVIILDESHMLKNFKSNRFKAAASIMKRANRLIMLSGTPALSRPSELYTQISAIDPTLFSNFQEYGVRYCAGKQQQWGWDYSGSSNMTELQIILEATIMIRRLKCDVISQLPSKQRMTIILDPSSIKGSTKAMQDAMKYFNQKRLKGSEKHGALLQLFNETASAKYKAVCDYIKELIEQNKKFLVFAHHKIMMDQLSLACEEMKVHFIRIDGATSSESRQKLVDHFQNTNSTKVAVLSITAANTGINLTAAQLVVFAELYWNPGLLVQAEDRVHRIGQTDSVLIQYLVAKGTADDHIWPLIQSKLNVLNKVGLSSDNFSEASTANQKVKVDEGILKYFTQLDPDDFEEPDNKKKRLTDEN